MKITDLVPQKHNFVPPSVDEEHDEVVFQFENDKQSPFLPNWVRKAMKNMQFEKMFKLMNRRNGDIEHITPEQQLNIGNTGDTWENSEWKPESKQRVEQLYKQSSQITMPTLLKNRQTGEYWLLGGHHRLTYNAQILKRVTPCWVINV